jgi:ribonuclease BN (tRNA processing enzyme)
MRGLRMAGALLAAAFFCAGPGAQPKLPTRVIMLGTGTPNADPERAGPATAIVVGDSVYLVDCGPGVVRRASAAGLKMPALQRVFLTHLHHDHTAGLADLMLTPWTLERIEPLRLYGPPGSAAMARNLLAAYKEDIRVRLDGLEPANPTGYKVSARDVKPGVVYKDALVTVRAFAVSHGSWQHAYGYRFETPDKVIVISGDTARSDEIARQARGADLLIHEVYSEAGWARRPPEWQKYHRAFHTSSRDLAGIAAAAQPRLLVLVHVLRWSQSEEGLLAEIAEGYKGRVVVAKDLDVFE